MAKVYKPVSHVLFDLDGVIVDMDQTYTDAVHKTAGHCGTKYHWELQRKLRGTPEKDAARLGIDGLGLPMSPEEYLAEMDRMSAEMFPLGLPMSREEYLAEMNRMYAEMFPKAELMPGVQRLVQHLHAHKVPMAIATSCQPSSFEQKTARHRELVALFDHVVCSGGNPEIKGKPHPDIFLVAASKFKDKPPPEKVLVFEDAPKGVTAALAAGMQVVMIPDPRMDEDNRRRATMCIASVLDFKPEFFGLPPF